MVAQAQPLAAGSAALTDMLDNYLLPLTDPQNENQMSQEYFTIMVRALLVGLEETLLPRESSN